MERLKLLSYVCATVGVLLMFCAVIGRFVQARTVFGGIVPSWGGMAASSVMEGANTFLLLAVLAYLYYRKN